MIVKIYLKSGKKLKYTINHRFANHTIAGVLSIIDTIILPNLLISNDMVYFNEKMLSENFKGKDRILARAECIR